MASLVIAQVLLVLVVGLWLAARFKDSPIIKFFGRNDWFAGAFLILVGYMNYAAYTVQYVRNLNIALMVIGIVLVLSSLSELMKK
jgi:hypothetical protein